MTVPAINPVNSYEGNSSVTTFLFEFLIEKPEELIVELTDFKGETVILENGIDYSITGTGNFNGGSITFPLSTSVYGVLREDEKITLRLSLPILQESEFRNSTYFNFNMLEHSFDYIVRVLQIMNRQLERSFKVDEGATISTDSLNEHLERLDEVIESVDTIRTDIEHFYSEYERCLNAILEQDIVNKGSIDLDNLSHEGESHFVNYSQITNCILEVPERIKYRLASGKLTVYAGSVIIVPYGKTRAYLNIGDTLEHNNFKVTDIQYINNNLFYWAELQNDIVLNNVATTDRDTRLISISFATNSMVYDRNTYSTANPAYTSSVTYFNTTENKIYQTGSNGANVRQLSFPIMAINADGSNILGKVKSVFNGIGYIGSTIFVDKGIRGLYANGFDEYGCAKNTEFTNSNLLLYTSTTNNSAYSIFLGTDNTLSVRSVRSIYYLQDYTDIPSDVITSGLGSYIHVANDNKWYNNNNTSHVWTQSYILPIVTATFSAGSQITDFIKTPVCRVVTTNDNDGKWVYSNAVVVQNLSIGDSSTAYTASLNDYLPQDSYTYEVIVRGQVTTGTSSSNYCPLYVSTSLVSPSNWYICSARTRTASSMDASGSCTILVPTDRNVQITRATNYFGTASLYVMGYRRVK